MLTKVCGLTQEKNIKDVLALGINYFGLIHYNKSPRHVTIEEINAVTTKDNNRKRAVVVSVNQNLKFFIKLAELGIYNFQLHGQESKAFIKEIKETIKGCNIFKALHLGELNNIDEISVEIQKYQEHADFILLDSGNSNKLGGTGEKFNWKMLSTLETSANLILSGGLQPEDYSLVSKCFDACQNLAGIDLNSGFETSPGKKDINKLSNFLDNLR